MSDDQTQAEVPAAKPSKLPLLIGLVLMLVMGGGGFFAAWSGMLPIGHEAPPPPEPEASAMPDVGYVAIERMVISLGPGGEGRHLQFAAQIEVNRGREAEVTTLMPRILDVLNSYLRAVDVPELEDPSALIRLRAQMLRRVQLVTGEGRVRDFLITQFVVN